ncbi:hypothetical protein FCL47_03275 [Desulfopila sp. IMCC35006]|uniref:lipid-binding SYLF domain-containing protein n=1 Tax=Desulfopila sp. IMCC35006 TaxID=2569542 RepID=UPI0010AC14E8|nr:lipid-binding SYLF domain-containing protein [Desulfopila sp. IMCC35006]TKB28517.1 hypothetical protein FCL47_03275 [Desulfopila sp. IMCC35006]
MKRLSVLFIFAFFLGLTNLTSAAGVDDYSATIKVFRDSPVVAKFYRNAYGYAVFPYIGKAGFVVGGAYGTGQVYKGGRVTGKSTVVKGSIGFQAGGKVFSQIVFFQDKRAYDEFTSGNFEFDATAQAIVITAGGEAQVGTSGLNAGATAGPRTGVQAETRYVKGMATFVHAKGGLMYELSIGGQKFTFERL